MMQVWILYHLQIIGEAVRAAAGELKSLRPDYAWEQVIGMRHILVHDYFGVDLAEVWAVVERDLPELRRVAEEIIEMLGDGG